MADPRLSDFVALNQPETRREVERRGDYFVVEGVLAIERLLTLPDWHVRSLALLPRAADRLEPLLAGRDLPVVVADEAELRQVVGFDLHRGALASVTRRAPTPAPDLLATVAPGGLVVATEGLNDHENLGALYRNAAAFGAAAVLVDPTTADPFYRRSVRVSQGHVLSVPTATYASIHELHEAGATTLALTPAGDVAVADVDTTGAAGSVVVLVGAEGPGLRADTLAAAHRRVRIPMAADVDSLNVATAAAVALSRLADGAGSP